jgi:methionine-rich copper-binding protein CopC
MVMHMIKTTQRAVLRATFAAALVLLGWTNLALGAPWTPVELPDKALWLDASDLSASPVSAWNDKSGNSRNFAQAAGGNQPAYSATSFNTSYPGVTFDGSSDFMSAGDTLDMRTNSLTVMSAVRYATGTDSGVIIAKTRAGGQAGRWVLYRATNGGNLGSGAQYNAVLQEGVLPSVVLQVANSSTSARINGFVLDRSTSGSCKIWDNGANTASATFTGNTTDFNSADQLWIGAYQNASGTTPPSGGYLNGVIAEVVVVQTAMSDTDRQKLEGYLAWKWGMQANLPANHPYKSAAPEANDTTPPTVATLNPTDDASGVLTYVNLSATFDEGIQKSTGNITLKKSADNSTVETFDVATSPRITVSGATLTINPTSNLEGNTGYYVEIDATAVKDLANNAFAGIAGATTWNFTTGVADTTAPTIATLSPADDATGADLVANLVATFDENIQKGTGFITLKKTADDSTVETFDVATSPRITVSGASLTIDPTANLAAATGYYVQIDPTAIQDLSGNSFAGIADSTTWNFTTTSSITVLNPSFQTPVLGDDDTENGTPTGWGATNPGGFTTWNPPGTIFAGAAGNGTPTGADGSQIYNFYHAAGASARLYQDTTAPLTAGMTYTLTVAIGARLTGNAVDVWGIDLMTTGQTLGGTPEAAVYLARTTGGRADLTSGQFVDKTVQFTVPAGHPNLGQNVRVHCWSKAAAEGETSAFDNVRLGVAATIPPPPRGTLISFF